MANDEDDQLDVKAVFEAFKRGIKEQVRDDDVATHFDLGVAYQDMGMFADAAAEFALVLRVNPLLFLRARGLMKKLMPSCHGLAATKQANFGLADLDEVDSLLADFQGRGTAQFSDAISQVRVALKNHALLEKLGVHVK